MPLIHPTEILLGSEAQPEASSTPDGDNPSDNRSEALFNTLAIPKVIGGTFAPNAILSSSGTSTCGRS
jgi:hypothetical protein